MQRAVKDVYQLYSLKMQKQNPFLPSQNECKELQIHHKTSLTIYPLLSTFRLDSSVHAALTISPFFTVNRPTRS